MTNGLSIETVGGFTLRAAFEEIPPGLLKRGAKPWRGVRARWSFQAVLLTTVPCGIII
jgi:hypothetical protein